MTKKINVDLLNACSDELNFVEAKTLGDIGIFLIDEKYTGGSVWQVEVSNADFSTLEGVKTFLEESSNLGESEAFEELEDAKEVYDEIK